MKLYTEEQLKLFYQLGKFDGIAGRENDVDEEIKNHTPIELPSDEEIQKESLKSDFEYTFRNGARWMRNKIQGGNK